MKKRIFAFLTSLFLLLGIYACGETSNPQADLQATCTHEFGYWEISVEATCISLGTETRTCTLCGKTEAQNIPKSDSHNTIYGKCKDCKKVVNHYEAFVYYIKQNGSYEDGEYSFLLGTDITDEAVVYSRAAYYDTIDRELSIAILWDNDIFLSITINEDSNIYEYGFLYSSYYMFGSFYPTTFSKKTTSLYCSSTNIDYSSLKTTCRELAASSACLLLLHLNNDLAGTGITAYGLGFINY